MKEGIVMLDELVTHDFIETFLVGQDSVLDMNRLLPDLLFKNSVKLVEASELLAVRFPLFKDTIDGSRIWLANCYNAQWADEEIVLTDCFPAGSQDQNIARYRIVSYVEYIGLDDMSLPTACIKSGHFVANFREGGVWYRADDSVLSVADSTEPKVFPYLCIFERVGLPVNEAWVAKTVSAPEVLPRRRLLVKTKVEDPKLSVVESLGRKQKKIKKQDRIREENSRMKLQRISHVKGGCKQESKLVQRSQNSREP